MSVRGEPEEERRRTWYAREKGRGERTGFLERAETVIGAAATKLYRSLTLPTTTVVYVYRGAGHSRRRQHPTDGTAVFGRGDRVKYRPTRLFAPIDVATRRAESTCRPALSSFHFAERARARESDRRRARGRRPPSAGRRARTFRFFFSRQYVVGRHRFSRGGHSAHKHSVIIV